ncbi:hypothetical protein CIRG_04989 [Coccidioides immitis RMSCC 2394]|uniref:Uncharacterized protein n=1 Tax=Coccidioides immitis RMSCC 2394 TaxID=404692 RepID=A0A0J6YEB4_COCIT|nr:hypothetical protein CIRG_04989 [Coccidioides immitis RMSCC 2394]
MTRSRQVDVESFLPYPVAQWLAFTDRRELRNQPATAGESDGVSSVQGRSTEGNALKIELFRFQGGILGSPPHSESETTRCTRAWQRYLRKYLMLVLSEQVQR